MRTTHGSERYAYVGRGKHKNNRTVPDAIPHFTTGQVFSNEDIIEPVRDSPNRDQLSLLLWDRKNSTIDSKIIYEGDVYVPAPIEPSILQALTLPTQIAPYISPRKLLTDIAELMTNYTGLSENSVAAASRWALATWLPEIRPAPDLSVVGPAALAGRQLMQLLHCLCRRPLLLTGVTEAGLLALPTEWQLTLLVVQPELSAGLQQILSSARKSVGLMPRGGRLLDFHCAVATCTELSGTGGSGIIPGLEIPLLPSSQRLPVLGNARQQQIASDFQPRLLRYRLENLSKALNSRFDLPELSPSMQEIAKSLTACTPEDPDLQAEVHEFFRIQDTEMRSAAWVDLNSVLIEVILAFVHEGKEHSLYVAEITTAAEIVLSDRGENQKPEPRAIGSRLRHLGLMTEPRDRRGIRLILSAKVSRHMHELARIYSVPLNRDTLDSCDFCKSKTDGRKSASRS